MDRRTFITLTAVTGSTTALGGCRTPAATLVRYLPDEDIQPGQSTWKPSVCTLCAAGCGLTVRVMDADADVIRDGQPGLKRILAAKKLDGAAAHPVNQGKLCARGQAGTQVTYHPDRITQPLKRTGPRGSGAYTAIAWDEALATFAASINALRPTEGGAPLTWLGSTRRGLRSAFIRQWLARVGGDGPIDFEPFSDDVIRRANAISFGRPQLPTYDLAAARFVLSLGADFLGTWNSPVAQSLGYGAMRQGQHERRGIRGRFVQVEARMSQTGANADAWVPANPGTEGALVLAIAHVLMKHGRPAASAGRAGAAIAGWSDGLPDFSPESVAATSGVTARRIEELARDLLELAPALLIAAGAPLAHSNGLATALAVNAVNALLGAIDRPGGVGFTPQIDLSRLAGLAGADAASPTTAPQTLAALVADRLGAAGRAPQLLVVDGINPVFSAPPAWHLREGLLGIPTIVSVGSFLDETSGLADLILPDHSPLESWVDVVPESGASIAVVSVAAPAVRPLYATRSTVDVLLDVSGRLRTPVSWPWTSHEELLGTTLGQLPPSSPDGDAWTDIQNNGGWWGALPPQLHQPAAATPPAATRMAPDVVAPPVPQRYEAAVFDGDATQYPLQLLPYASSTLLDGSLAHLPWLQEMPDPLTSAMWSTWIELHPATAATHGVGDGDIVRVSSVHGAIEAAVFVSPAIAPTLVAIPAGQGHTTFTRYASGRGANPFHLLSPRTDDATGALAWASTRVKLERVSDADGRLVLFAGGLRAHGAHDEPPAR